MSFLSQPVQNILLKPKRMIGPIEVQTVINESSSDVLTITKQPVQQGASITDHAYLEPTTFSTTVYFKDNLTLSLSKIYQNLLDLQASRVPFDIVTPKRIYSSMLLATLSQVTDKNTENCLSISATFQEVIIVSVLAVQVPRSRQKNAGTTGATAQAGKKSFLATAKEALTGSASKIPSFLQP